jgi:endonuclease/exonuclease/phosphatase (EEP) superfamily protein YafD
VFYDEVSKARSTSVLISTELGTYVVGTGRSNTSVLPSVVAVPTGAGPTIVAAHPVAPLPQYVGQWRSDLAWLAAQCEGDDVIVAGDLNATLDHMSGLEAPAVDVTGAETRTDLGRCRDAARLAGAGAIGTWPTGVPSILGTAIDHVLATPSWRVSGFRVIGDRDEQGSDHRPILAQLTRAG